MYAFEPSSRAPSAPGPTTVLPCARKLVGEPVDDRLVGADDEEVGVEFGRRACRRR